MDLFEITGGQRLAGTISVAGLKNAATPCLTAALLTKETVVLKNIPRIEDVFRMIEILEHLGAEISWRGKNTVAITARDIDARRIDQQRVKRLRSSVFLLGALSARCDMFSLMRPGGCVIGRRPVETHIDALRKLGVVLTERDDGFLIDARNRVPGTVVLREMSVTATENALLLAALLPGRSLIKIAAAEPHVGDLCRLLVAMGAHIRGIGTHTLEVSGRRRLHGTTHTIIPDHNEAATFLVLGVATGSPITVRHARQNDLDLVLEKLREFGADFICKRDAITVVPAQQLRAVEKVETRTYPGIPTDAQALFGVLATQAEGETLIFDTLFEGRFNYIYELEKMGARIRILNPHQVLVSGKTPLRGTTLKGFDLRAGAALIIAALTARGKTTIEDIYQVDRGYERIEERLQHIGAAIRRVSRSD